MVQSCQVSLIELCEKVANDRDFMATEYLGFKTFLHLLRHISDTIVKFKLDDNIIRWIYCELITNRRGQIEICLGEIHRRFSLTLLVKDYINTWNKNIKRIPFKCAGYLKLGNYKTMLMIISGLIIFSVVQYWLEIN